MKFKLLSVCICMALVGQLAAQCVEASADIWEDTWESCEPSANPNSNRGASHWLHYDLGAPYILSKTRIWNTNELGKLSTGFKQVIVDYSVDGIRWTELGRYDFSQGIGEAIYAGFQGPDFEAATARYVLFTAISNWGHASCFGLAEVKFNITTENSIPEDDDSSIPLPIELLSFEATLVNEKDALLHWETATEQNSHYFEILKSTNGTLWQSIGKQQAKGFSTSKVNYDFLDENAFGKNSLTNTIYYKLQYFDLDGTSRFSEIRSVTKERSSDNLISIYPNPTQGKITLHSHNRLSKPLEIILYNEIGQQVLSIQQPDTGTPLNISSLEAGFYTLFIRSGQVVQYLKIIKI